jgi:hypothetical protein
MPRDSQKWAGRKRWGLSRALMSFVNDFDVLKSPLVQAKDYIASIGGNEIGRGEQALMRGFDTA